MSYRVINHLVLHALDTDDMEYHMADLIELFANMGAAAKGSICNGRVLTNYMAEKPNVKHGCWE